MNLNLEIYGKQYPPLGMDPRNKATFKSILKGGETVLDIGGASGRFLESINRNVCSIRGAVVDSDPDCIEYGKKTYPHIEFIYGEFPKKMAMIRSNCFDVVMMNALFCHLFDWKMALREMARIAKKYLIVQTLIRIDGNTIDDIDTSYLYYLDTGKRVKQTIHNIWQFMNFLCLEEIKAKHIWFDGWNNFNNKDKKTILDYKNKLKAENIKENDGLTISHAPHAFRGAPGYEVYNDTWIIELWPPEKNPKRMGGIGFSKDHDIPGYKFYMPEIDIHIDGHIYFVARDNQIYYNTKPIFELDCIKEME